MSVGQLRTGGLRQFVRNSWKLGKGLHRQALDGPVIDCEFPGQLLEHRNRRCGLSGGPGFVAKDPRVWYVSVELRVTGELGDFEACAGPGRLSL